MNVLEQYYGMNYKDVLHNLKQWDFDIQGRIRLSKDESDIIVKALERLIEYDKQSSSVQRMPG